ncbi:MAG: DUF1874 domain-containing protein [Burkholderiaceae bacterium]|nr:DUF1874 domain-containing protein [Burkholderiaceae bacterium]
MRYVLNSPVLTSFGTYSFTGPIDIERARRFVESGAQSAVGHASTARFLTRLLGVEIRCERCAITMHPGDAALVFRLNERPGAGSELQFDDLDRSSYQLGLLTRIE